MTLLLDTTVVMYAVGQGHPYRAVCGRILRAISSQVLDAAADVELFQEVLHRFSAVGRRAEALRLIQDLAVVIPTVLPVTREVIALIPALGTHHERLSARDLLHLAVMRHYGLTRILTADRDFDGIPGIERVDPLVVEFED